MERASDLKYGHGSALWKYWTRGDGFAKWSGAAHKWTTLRDLLLKGYRASAIRFLLISVPYRNQMNFTFDSLTESTNAIDRLRTFHQRMLKGPWPEEVPQGKVVIDNLRELIHEAQAKYTAALANSAL